MDRQRIDKWLWHARIVRTRSAAAALVDRGRVRLNGARIDAASRPVRVGDVLTVALDRVKILKVLGFCDRRGGAAQAAALFEDIAASAGGREDAAASATRKRERPASE
ncbi:MAG: RNA-binding S4 domain-containing protein [Pseudorhodoplanes sp.]